ncbi:MAG: DUF364 domain-containing protein [Halobacteria archaeon]|nr:DUF364 domain-containing protein [Halobacteria archaeon]
MKTERDILGEALERLKSKPNTSGATVGRFVVGERLVLVEVEHNLGRTAGVAHRPSVNIPDEGRIEGSEALSIASWAVDPPGNMGARAVGIGTLNALSAPYIDWNLGDPMEALDEDVEVIGTVGFFRPALRKFNALEVRVIEKDAVKGGVDEGPPGVSVSVFDTSEYEEALEGVEILFVTGSSLVYGGAGDYLKAAEDIPTVVLIGATSSFLPEPAFDAGVDILAGARVDDSDSVINGIQRGACGTDLHDSGLRKVYVSSEESPLGIKLNGNERTTNS